MAADVQEQIKNNMLFFQVNLDPVVNNPVPIGGVPSRIVHVQADLLIRIPLGEQPKNDSQKAVSSEGKWTGT